MKSVPPRGSGWVYQQDRWPLAFKCDTSFDEFFVRLERPTRYRVVVLTSSSRVRGVLRLQIIYDAVVELVVTPLVDRQSHTVRIRNLEASFFRIKLAQ